MTLELVKFWQASFMETDVLMFDQTQEDGNMKAQSSNINEELGQIEYVFSDKTGTLTCNIMTLSKISTMQDSYVMFDQNDDRNENDISLEELKEIAKNKKSKQQAALDEVLMLLVLCHTVILDARTGKLNAASPDELALVEGATPTGYKFLKRDQNKVIYIETPQKETLRYKLLNVLEFNSDRKRMSVVIEDLQTKKILLYTKGADAIILPLLSANND